MDLEAKIRRALESCVGKVEYDKALKSFHGKVRDTFQTSDEEMLIVVSDRISAFDFILGTVPFKGQVLNQVANWWFRQMDEIGIRHHLIDEPDPNVARVKLGKTLPVEVVVRGYLTGTTTTSAWYAYQNHDRKICGIEMPEGMVKNQVFDTPIITPTTKPEKGHDEPISEADILSQGLVKPDIWEEVKDMALRIFAYGQKKAAEQNLILVDTKYEFALDQEGNVMVVDEIHTSDSSRYWIADTYGERFQAGEEPQMLDKEFVRRMTIDNGYDVDDANADPADFFDDAIRIEASKRYIQLYEQMTGEAFVFPQDADVLERIERYLSSV